MMGITVKPTARRRMRELQAKLLQMHTSGVITLQRNAAPEFNCVLGFSDMHVHRICEFNGDLKRMVEDDVSRSGMVMATILVGYASIGQSGRRK